MEIVIKIHEKDYQSMKNGHIPFGVLDAFKNGTPLPKGHGRLIDADQYKQTLVGYIDKNENSDDMFLAGCGDGAYHAMCMLKDISTIVEADGGGEDGKDKDNN